MLGDIKDEPFIRWCIRFRECRRNVDASHHEKLNGCKAVCVRELEEGRQCEGRGSHAASVGQIEKTSPKHCTKTCKDKRLACGTSHPRSRAQQHRQSRYQESHQQKPEQLRANRVHFQGNAETFLAEAAHVIGFDSWTIEHVPGGADGPTLARASLGWTQQGSAVRPRRIMARNKQMEQRLSRSDGNVDGGSGRSAASMNMQSPTMNIYQGRRLRGADARHRVRASVECPDLPHLHTTPLLVTHHLWPFATGNMPLSDCLTPHFTLSSTLEIFVFIFYFEIFNNLGTCVVFVSW